MMIRAIYENGVFRPVQPVTLEDGTAVDVIPVAREARLPREVPPPTGREVAAILREIAALHSPTIDESLAPEDIDKFLYDGEGGVR